jgi:hypothetical protein
LEHKLSHPPRSSSHAKAGDPVFQRKRSEIERPRRTGSPGPVYANRLRPKADFGGSRGFDGACGIRRAEALAKAASRAMTTE